MLPLACSLPAVFLSPPSGTGPGDTKAAPVEPSEPCGDALLSLLGPLALGAGVWVLGGTAW